MRWLCLLLLLLLGGRAEAHLTPNSEVRLDLGQHQAVADIIIPLGDYAAATGNPTDNGPAALERARRYLTDHIAFRSPDGRPWIIGIKTIAFAQIQGPPDLHAIAQLTPPPGAPTRHLVIDWRAIIDAVPGHFALFVLGSEFGGGKLGEERHVLGAVQGTRHLLTVDRGDTSLLRGFAAAFLLGMRHIAEGHDHLLFLIALLLPAPLLASGGRWTALRPWRSTLWHLAGIVSAFTIGHSLTLIGAAAFDWSLPARPVEMLIALSILVSAVHVLRPIFPGREAVVAGGFGLVHGLAFATIVGHFGLGVQEKTLTILGFNLGIETVQMLVVAAVLPSFLLLAPTRWFGAVRVGGGVLAMVAALAWLAERWLGQANAVGALLERGFAQSLWLIVALTVAGMIARRRTAKAAG
ncbi:HupE/UreJ family protein [soil metagenome]